eukprot:TRINITY_DN12_c2_g1_i3.p1 TRINITY_DN12_c2_g1~~TRINITY_DN12_c2_g1_i3.p1  ORF type:complete len:148 (+),score=52.49 TRINITY_DN12_c2_g1_i3:602-1045(+)
MWTSSRKVDGNLTVSNKQYYKDGLFIVGPSNQGNQLYFQQIYKDLGDSFNFDQILNECNNCLTNSNLNSNNSNLNSNLNSKLKMEIEIDNQIQQEKMTNIEQEPYNNMTIIIYFLLYFLIFFHTAALCYWLIRVINEFCYSTKKKPT